VHVEDAAATTVAALECDPGVYNRCGRRSLGDLARFLGAPAPPHISEEQAFQTRGPDAVYYAMRLRGASNAYAKQKLGFVPRKLEWLSTSKAAAK
jgi:nucleoside-diphosphate-sugar epimerase